MSFESAREVEGFPDYVVDREGTVYTKRNEARRRPSQTQQGAYKITMYRNGTPFTKSLALVVAQTWLYNDFDPEIFDTPIHLDNDPANNHVDNLAWRPRWFAVKYQKQYWNREYRFSRIRIREDNTENVFDNPMFACQRYGLLFIDVLKSCNQGEEVFPTRKIFSYV